MMIIKAAYKNHLGASKWVFSSDKSGHNGGLVPVLSGIANPRSHTISHNSYKCTQMTFCGQFFSVHA